MEWVFCDSRGKKSKKTTSFQKDIVGNIVQFSGAINPKACQKCSKKFKSKIIETPVTQKIPIYKCRDCDFSNPSADAVFLHLRAHETHKMDLQYIDKIVKTERQIKGNIPYIRKTKTDVKILCESCKPKTW